MPATRTVADAVAELLAAEAERVANNARRDRLRAEIADLTPATAPAGGRYATALGTVVVHPAGEGLLPQVLDEAAYLAWCRVHHPGRVLRYALGTAAGVEQLEEVDAALLAELAAAGELRRFPSGAAALFDAEGRHVPGIGAVETSFGLEVALAPEARAAARLDGAGLDPTLAELDR